MSPIWNPGSIDSDVTTAIGFRQLLTNDRDFQAIKMKDKSCSVEKSSSAILRIERAILTPSVDWTSRRAAAKLLYSRFNLLKFQIRNNLIFKMCRIS